MAVILILAFDEVCRYLLKEITREPQIVNFRLNGDILDIDIYFLATEFDFQQETNSRAGHVLCSQFEVPFNRWTLV
jgi:hypothetical protein